MNELVFVLPSFIMSFIFGYLAININHENGNVLLQILFFILTFFFAISGFASQVSIADSYNATVKALANTAYQASIFTMIATVSILLFLILASYFNMFGKVVWNRKTHRYEKKGIL